MSETTLPQGNLKRIHINQHRIKSNAKNGADEPVVTVKHSKGNYYGHSVEVDGPSRVVYGEKPLSCGARVWVETREAVRVTSRE